jgi:protease I
MLHKAKDLRRYTLMASDGETGRVDDILFDDVSWTVRYFVVDTGGWLTGRLVLISPASFEQPDHDAKRISVALTKGQIENAPSIYRDRPVSRQHEEELSGYYGWPRYWGMGALAGFGAAPVYPPPGPSQPTEAEEIARGAEQQPDPHLRSIKEIVGYGIQATDGKIGHVEDLIIDDSDWRVRYLVIDTRDWLPGKDVLLAVPWIQQVSWPDRKVHVNLTKDTIKNSPEYDSSKPPTREYEEALFDYYGRPRYWEEVEAMHRRESAMRGERLDGRRVAILITDDFERVELAEPRQALEEAGAKTFIIAPHGGEVQSMNHDVKAEKYKVDLTLDEANPDDFDALLLPGGALNADVLRMDQRARDFVRRIDQTGKPIAVICHAPWLLVSAGLVQGRTITSYYTLQDDIRNAGGRWLDTEVVRDRNWVSSRGPRDLPAFTREMISLFSESVRERRKAA